MQYHKTCPKCNGAQTYVNNSALQRAIKRNSICRKCLMLDTNYIAKITKHHIGKKRSKETRDNISKAYFKNIDKREKLVGAKNPMFGIKGEKHHTYNRHHTDEERKKMRVPRSEEFKTKMRILAQERSGGANYNKTACGFFDFLNKEYNLNGKHALNGGEHKLLGYSVDYYEPKLNLVIEWDEEQHYIGNKLHSKCVKRQQQITKHLNCTFIRIRPRGIMDFNLLKDKLPIILDDINV